MPFQIDSIKSLFDNLKKDQKQVLILAVILTAIALFAYFSLLIKPQTEGLFKTIARVGKVKADLKSAQADIARIDQMKANILAYSEKIGRYGAMLPTEDQMPALLESMSDMARAASMKIVGVTPVQENAPASKGQAYKPIPITINARAGYHELGRFFAALENSGRFMKVADVAIRENRASPKKHDVDIVVIAYVLLEGK